MNKMLLLPAVLLAFVLNSFGCAKPVSQAISPTSLPVEAAADAKPNATAPVPFAGSWQSCAGAESPELCSRYLLVQRGKRICGTWLYFASGDSYEGRVIAEAISSVEARRTGICGRPGSETQTECEAGWDTIDRPLRLCSGKLGDLDSKDGRCFADFERVGRSDPSLDDLAAQAWVEACLSPDDISRQLAGGLVEKARERGLDTIEAAKFTPDGTKVGMTDTANLSAEWAKTAVGDVGQLAGQKLSQSSENVAVINQQQALEQSLKPTPPAPTIQGPEDPTPKGPRLV